MFRGVSRIGCIQRYIAPLQRNCPSVKRLCHEQAYEEKAQKSLIRPVDFYEENAAKRRYFYYSACRCTKQWKLPGNLDCTGSLDVDSAQCFFLQEHDCSRGS